jgi:phospholipase C
MGECTHDLNHTWPAEHMSRGADRNADFVKTHTSTEFEGPQQGVVTMGYYERADLPFYYALADAFTICDNYHCSVMGPTHPNRLMALSGTIDPAGKAGGPVIITNDSTDAIWSASWPTMPEVLEDAGISWKVYNPEGALYAPSFFEQHGLLAGDAILPYFSQYKDPSSSLYQKAFLPQYPTDFVTDVATGKLPAGTPGEYLTVDPLPADANGIHGPVGMGFRVPMLVISPFSQGGYVASDVFDHTSQL